MLLCAVAAIATFSRAALLGTFVGGSVFTGMRILRRDDSGPSATKRAQIGWSLLVLGLVVIVILAIGAGGLLERLQNDSIAADVRFRLWRDAWAVLKDHPLGIGRGAFDRVFPIYRTLLVKFPIRFSFVESHPYQMLIDAGWPGFAALLCGLALVVRVLVRSGRRDAIECALLAGVVAVAVHSLTDFGLETLGVLLPYCALLGTLLGRCHSEERAARRWRGGVAVVVAAAGIVIGAGSLCLASSDNFDMLVKHARNGREAQELLRRAQEIHPTDYFYALSYANSLPLRAAQGGPSPRLHGLNRALLRCPSCEEVHLAVARSLWQLRRRQQSLGEWTKAVQLDSGIFARTLIELHRIGATPEEMAAVASFDANSMLLVANFLADLNLPRDAVKVLDQADAMYAPGPETLITRARLSLQTGQIEAAKTTLAEIRSAGIQDARIAVLDARLQLAAKGDAGAEEALSTLDAAAARYPLDVEVQRERLELVTRFQKWQVADRAVEGLKVALYHAQGQATEAHLASARIHARLRHWTQSFNEYRIALVSDPGNGAEWMEFGRTAEEAGRLPVAREAYAEAARVMPNDPSVVAAIRRIDDTLNAVRLNAATAAPVAPEGETSRAAESP
ncbi:MAG TPA: O-antigen ligase family protein [Polyangia bacterium]|nr:O-antigen ligase family protein [Polyangia bacterium]